MFIIILIIDVIVIGRVYSSVIVVVVFLFNRNISFYRILVVILKILVNRRGNSVFNISLFRMLVVFIEVLIVNN